MLSNVNNSIALFVLVGIATTICCSEKNPTLATYKPAHQETITHTPVNNIVPPTTVITSHNSSPLSYRDEYNEGGCLRSFRGPIVCAGTILLVLGGIGGVIYVISPK